mmetsp:Transcript_159929/g.509238  ORF Transcript_159929/g.509238 Transcript_159929/m.509238 type:complete len:252 (+) Transcript_159929:30-785(+)
MPLARDIPRPHRLRPLRRSARLLPLPLRRRLRRSRSPLPSRLRRLRRLRLRPLRLRSLLRSLPPRLLPRSVSGILATPASPPKVRVPLSPMVGGGRLSRRWGSGGGPAVDTASVHPNRCFPFSEAIASWASPFSLYSTKAAPLPCRIWIRSTCPNSPNSGCRSVFRTSGPNPVTRRVVPSAHWKEPARGGGPGTISPARRGPCPRHTRTREEQSSAGGAAAPPPARALPSAGCSERAKPSRTGWLFWDGAA